MTNYSAIEINNISKQFYIGNNQSVDTLRDLLASFVSRKKFLVNKSKNKIWALKDINFKINRGETVGLIGCNGSGKSTLLKVLSRITTPDLGFGIIRGRVASLLEVGTGFHLELTGRENIFLNGSILGMKQAEIKKRFSEIVTFAGVEKFIDTPVKHYSSGMYLRLAFSVAAHLESDILLVDEVLAVGDAKFQQKCLGKMASLSKKESKTIVFVSHDLEAVSQLCKRTICLFDGKIVQDGVTEEVIKNYKNEKETWSSDRHDR